jgi:hypothetical protein
VSFVSPTSHPGTFDEPDWEKEAAASLAPWENAFRRDDAEAFSTDEPDATRLMSKTSPNDEQIHHATISSGFHQTSESPHVQHHSNVSTNSFVVSPAQSHGLGGINPHSSPSLITAASPAFSLKPSWPFESANEARLLHHYIIHVAPWVCVPSNPPGSLLRALI